MTYGSIGDGRGVIGDIREAIEGNGPGITIN